MNTLTIADAIEKLRQYPPDMIILVDGYEGGYDNPIITEEFVVLLKSHHDFEGPYASFEQEGGTVCGYMNALVFGRDKSGG